MRKTFAVMLLAAIAVLCIVLVVCPPAMAEALAQETQPVVLFDLTDVLIAVALAVGGYVWRKWVRPWLEARELMEEAEIVVNAAEALIGRGNGAEKWAMAVERMREYGFDVDVDAVLDALRAAWRKLNTEQLAAGEKEKTPEQ